MNVLEKILEEIEIEEQKQREVCKDIIKSPGYRIYEKAIGVVKDIISSNMNEVGEKIRKIADHYGWEEQHRNAIEEMAELTKAICKRERKYHGSFKSESAKCPERTEIIGEIADVKIMLAQMEYLLSAEDEVQMVINQKVERQLERMRHECT